MREADTAPCDLRPPEDRKVPARPVLDALRAGIVLLLQPQQHEVAGVAGREAGDLDVVAHQVLGGGEAVVLALEELLLEIPARAPAQHAADVQVLAQDVPHHVLRLDALGGLLVVRAAGRVDVVIAGVPAHLRRIDPALEPERLRHAARSARGRCCVFFRYSGPRVYSTV